MPPTNTKAFFIRVRQTNRCRTVGVSTQSGQRFYYLKCIINQLATTYNVYYLADPFRWENLIGITWAQTPTEDPICALVFSEYVLSIEVNESVRNIKHSIQMHSGPCIFIEQKHSIKSLLHHSLIVQCLTPNISQSTKCKYVLN